MTTTPTTALRTIAGSASADDIMRIFTEDGAVIIQDFLTPEQVKSLNEEIDAEIGAITPGSKRTVEGIPDFHGANTKRMTRMTQRSRTFRDDVLELDLMHDLGDAVFGAGAYWLMTAQVIQIGPGNEAQPLHRDIEGWPGFVGVGPEAPEVIVNFLVALTDFTDDNGGTRVIPGSNTWPDFEERGTPEMTIPVEMKAGDAVFFSGKVVHGGGSNRTADEHRRGLALPLLVGYLTPEEPWPFLIDVETVRGMSERAQRMIGFRSHFAEGQPGTWYVDSAELADYLGL